MNQKKNVLIVGAGAAGTAAAYSLSKHPEKFKVEVWEKGSKIKECMLHFIHNDSQNLYDGLIMYKTKLPSLKCILLSE
jgi:2-polyprenyl-6-methoxyphenol hydroxylase-like FAD-dependent oxidoreductase